jgi:hypothetical protein
VVFIVEDVSNELVEVESLVADEQVVADVGQAQGCLL